MTEPPAGTLFLCPTPIGNLEDITLRALRVLKDVDLIAAEDTRQTRKLTRHYQIPTPLVSFHQHNQRERARELIARLKQGQSVALVADAGMPGISDPGFELISGAIAEGIPVVALPGPTALITALVVSGLPTGRFTFEGFLPRKKGERRRFLEARRGHPYTMVFFEAPHRLLQTLSDLEEIMGDRRLVVVRELSKVHEETIRGTVREVRGMLEGREVRGEITLVVEGVPAVPGAGDYAAAVKEITTLVREGLSKKEAISLVARRRRLPRRQLYSLMVDWKPK